MPVRIVLLVLDAFPSWAVNTRTAPTLRRLAAQGCWHPDGGKGVLTAATYPNHATFATGAPPHVHGIVANRVWSGTSWQPAAAVGPSVPTIFDACLLAGRGSAAAVGDQHLVGVMGLAATDEHWPPHGELPPGTAVDVFGYPTNRVVLDRALPLLDDGFHLVLVHLNGPDTAAHLHGPASEEACAAYRSTDAAVAELVVALSPRWDDTVLLVCSDHDQERVTAPEPLDLDPALATLGPAWTVAAEGSAAVVVTPDDADAGEVLRLPGVIGAERIAAGRWAVWGAPGTWFAPASSPRILQGVHGSPRTRQQLALVAGGAPAVRAISATVRARGVAAEDYAPTIATLLDLPLRDATGTPLL